MAPRKKQSKAKQAEAAAAEPAPAPAAKRTRAKKAPAPAVEPAPAAPTAIEIETQTEDVRSPAGTPEWLLERRAVNRMQQAKHRAEVGPNTSPAERERQRVKWEKYKDEYNAQRRARTAEAKAALGAAAKGPGRPARPTQPGAPQAGMQEEDLAVMLNEAPKDAGEPDVIEVPEELQSILGEEIRIPNTKSTLPAFHTKDWYSEPPEGIKEATRKAYLNSAKGALKLAGYPINDNSNDPLEVSQFMLQQNVDPWKVILACIDPDRVVQSGRTKGRKVGNDTLNADAKGLLGVTSVLVKHLIATRQTSGRAWVKAIQLNLIFQKFNSVFKKGSQERHAQQGMSEQAKSNMIGWDTWLKIAEGFIKANSKPDATFEQLRNAVIIAMNAWRPPTRLEFADLTIAKEKPKRFTYKNVLVDDGKGITLYFGSFKNSHSFSDQLPLAMPVKSKKLVNLLRRYIASLKATAVFPRKNVASAKPMSHSDMGTLIGDITAELAEGRRFTSQRIRISYISNWHRKNKEAAGLNLKKTRELMRDVLQTNLQINLGYSKLQTEEFFQREFAAIEKEAE